MPSSGLDLLFRAIDVSFDRRKVVVTVAGLGLVVVVAGAIGALAIDVGDAAGAALLLVALVVAWVLGSLVTGSVARMCLLDLSGHPSPDWREALGYATAHLPGFLFAPILLGIGIGLGFVLEGILAFIGRLPAVGEILVPILYLPFVLFNLLLFVLAIFGGVLIPAVIAAEGTGPVATLRRLVTLVRGAPGRVVTYLSIALGLVMFLALVLAILVGLASGVAAGLVGLGLGEKAVLVLGGTGFDPASALVEQLTGINLGGLSGLARLFGREATVTEQLGGLLFQLAQLLLFAVVLAIPGVILPQACACAVYLSLVGTMAPMPVRMPAPTPAAAPPAIAPAPSVPGPQPAAATAQPAPSPAAPRAQPVQPAGATAHCVRCGRPLRQGVKFCNQCGARQV